jgi:acyl carrier protein
MDEIKKAIQESLAKFWEERSFVADELDSVENFIDEIDSLTAVDALIPIEKITGMDIDATSVIRRGGYESKEQFVEHLSAQVLKYVQEHSK